MTSEGDSGAQPQAELNAMPVGESEAVSSQEGVFQQNAEPAAAPNCANEGNIASESNSPGNEDIAPTGGVTDSNGVTDGSADTPFPVGAEEGGEGEEPMREPTLAHCVESEEPSAPDRASVIASVKVLDTGEKKEVQADFDASVTAADVQQRLAGQLQVKPDDLQLMVCGKELLGAISLTACPRNSEGSIVIEAIAKPAEAELAAGRVVGRSISVVRGGSDKPYLGGYRNKNTGAVFHNACSQTQRAQEPEAPKPKRERFCREAQTVDMKVRSTQSKREFGTQMPRPDLLLDTSRDRVLALDLEKGHQSCRKYDRTAVTIQRYARGFIARKEAAKLKHSRDELNEFLAKQAEREAHVAEKVRRSEVERRMKPRTTEDFEVLYNELEAWRLQQTRAIHAANLPEVNRRAAMQALLHKETRLLQTIDRLKRGALEQNKKVRVDKMMRGLASPKSWSLMNGRTVSVHTPLTTRARELMHLYHGLTLPLLRMQERLDVLLHVKWTVKEFDCNLTREIVDLIDREADLLNRGRSLKSVDGLRRRIAGLFLAFIETPEFNPEAAALQVLPDDPSSYLQQGAKIAARS